MENMMEDLARMVQKQRREGEGSLAGMTIEVGERIHLIEANISEAQSNIAQLWDEVAQLHDTLVE